MKVKEKVGETFANRSPGFWIGFGAALGVDLLLAVLVMYVTLVYTPQNRVVGAINREIPLAIAVVTLNAVALALLARYRQEVYRGVLIAFWIVVVLVVCFGCSIIAWAMFAYLW